MNEEERAEAGTAGRWWLGSALVVGLVAGYLLGERAAFEVGPLAEKSTPFARVGLALRGPSAAATRADWMALRRDVDAVRASLKPEERAVFDLVAAVRGLDNGGSADFVRAEALCRGLEWPRCDAPALEELQKRSRP